MKHTWDSQLSRGEINKEFSMALRRKCTEYYKVGNGFFPVGGREILIKAVAQAIPSYTMSIVRSPVILCHHLRSMIVNFWWAATREEKCINWRKWSLLCRSKAQGWKNKLGNFSPTQLLLQPKSLNINISPLQLSYRLISDIFHHMFGGVC